MRPIFHHELATARIADLHHHAARERAAKTARHAQSHLRARPMCWRTVASLARRALTLAGGRSPSPIR
jgi:hypothetical protein